MDLKKTPKDVCFTKINLWNIFFVFLKPEIILGKSYSIVSFKHLRLLKPYFLAKLKLQKPMINSTFCYPHNVYMFIVFDNKIKEKGLKTLN